MLYTIAVILLIAWLLGWVGVTRLAPSYMCPWLSRSRCFFLACSAVDGRWHEQTLSRSLRQLTCARGTDTRLSAQTSQLFGRSGTGV